MNQKYKIAFYKDFPDHENLQKSIKKLENGDFSQVKKLTNSSYFRIKVDYEDRIIFTFLKYQNENFILLLEYIPNHEYEKSQFLRGKIVDEEEFLFPDENQIDEAIFINNKNEFRYLEKFISFSESQENILTANPPIILIGSAGSGKTSILIEKIRNLNGKVLYTSLSKNLVENSKNICNCFENENIDFLTFGELFNIQNEVNFEHFKEFAKRYKIREIEKYFEEFRGVIAGTFEESYLSEEKYLNLGLKESIFNQQDKKSVYDIFNKYLNYLKSNNLSDSNMQELNLSNNYDFIVIDEVQDFTNSQIFAILKYGQNFILSGDSNQIIYSNFFSWSKLKTMLFKTEENSQITILKENYRNSESITNLSNKVLKIKQLRFGSIDRESNYLINTVNKQVGKVSLWFDKSMVSELNEKKRDDVNFAVVVFDENSKQEAKKSFQTPLIFTVQEAKGLEYKNIILFNFISNESKKFLEIISDLKKSDLENELKYSRPKDKTDRELDIYKIYINSLYVALTRGIENIFIFEKKEHRIFEILGLIKSKKEILKQTSSDTEIWKKEVEKLEKFGRTEQIENIQKRQKERVSVKTKLEKSLENDLKKEALNPDRFNKKAKDKLFEIAKSNNDLETLTMLSNLKYKKAERHLKSVNNKSENGIKVKNKQKFSKEIDVAFQKIEDRIYSKEFAEIYLLDELSYAQAGHKIAQTFVKQSNLSEKMKEFKLESYSNDIINQVENIEQTLLQHLSIFLNNPIKIASVRTGVLDKVMQKFSLGKYEAKIN